jgi:hypothetical protein
MNLRRPKFAPYLMLTIAFIGIADASYGSYAIPMHRSQLGVVMLRRKTPAPAAGRIRSRRVLYIVTASVRTA